MSSEEWQEGNMLSCPHCGIEQGPGDLLFENFENGCFICDGCESKLKIERQPIEMFVYRLEIKEAM